MDGTGYYIDAQGIDRGYVDFALKGRSLMIFSQLSGELLDEWLLSLSFVHDYQQGDLVLASREFSKSRLTCFYMSPQDLGLEKMQSVRERVEKVAKYLIAIILFIGFVSKAVPILSTEMARKMPFTWEKFLFGSTQRALLKSQCKTAEGEQAISRLLERMALNESVSVPPIQVFVEPNKEVNAFALPGGAIILNQGFLAAAESPDEVAGVLAHEIGHVIRRHMTSGLIRGLVLAWLVGPPADAAHGPGSGLESVLEITNNKFSRSAELEADSVAIQILKHAQIGKNGFIHFFSRHQLDSESPPEWASTHPSDHSRIQMIRASDAPLESSQEVLSDSDWDALRSICD